MTATKSCASQLSQHEHDADLADTPLVEHAEWVLIPERSDNRTIAIENEQDAFYFGRFSIRVTEKHNNSWLKTRQDALDRAVQSATR